MTPSRALRCSLVLALGAALVGCSSGNSTRTSHSAVKGNLMPGMSTLNQRPDDVENMWAMTKTTNRKALRADWYRIILYERPSRLSYIPVPH